MNWLLVGCLLTPMVTSVACFVLPSNRSVQQVTSILGTSLLVILTAILLRQVWSDGPVAAQMGGWDAPFGITLVADNLSAVLALVAGLTALAVAFYARADIDTARLAGGFHGFLHILMTGVIGAFLTGDLFNLYVWFEVMLIASFALMTLGGDRVQLDGAVKYVVINLVSTVLLLVAIGLVYGLTGTLNMADLHARMSGVEQQGLVSAVAVIFLVAFGIKAAVFPLFFWLPASYHTPPISVVTVFAALMTKVGVYALLRTFTLIFSSDSDMVSSTVLVVALATMLTGVMGALAFGDIRRILSFHIIGSIGFMLLGLGLGTPLALAASIFYMVHGILIKATLFMIAGVIGRHGGSYHVSELGGLYRNRPAFAIGFLLAAFSLIGFPPLSGFWAKIMTIEAGLDAQAPFVIFVVLVTSLMTFIPLMRIWHGAFWQKSPTQAPAGSASHEMADEGLTATATSARSAAGKGSAQRMAPGSDPALTALMIPIVLLTAVSLSIGLAPSSLIDVANGSAEQLLSPDLYIEAVMGGEGPVDVEADTRAQLSVSSEVSP